LKFLGELWERRACARTNPQELTTCAKSGGHDKKKFKKKGAGRPSPGVKTWSPVGHGLTPGHGRPGSFFLVFLKKIQIFYWKFVEWVRAFGRMGSQYTCFFKLPPTLAFLIEFGDFIFFGNFIFSKFRVNMDLHIYRFNFRFMDNQNH
jgi:hypothetical protein